MAEHWSRFEVEAIVADYMGMLELQLRGKRPNKTVHRRELARLLNERNDSSIEYKHRNISAILEEAGYPFLAGYKPLSNYQGLLADVVFDRLRVDRPLQTLIAADTAAVPSPTIPTVEEILRLMVSPPKPDRQRRRTRERGDSPYRVKVVPHGVNYLEQEARNRDLGYAGELFVVRFEQARLLAAGRDNLAADVKHASQSVGDGLGYDIVSFDETGVERLIEVKTTKHGKATPFFVSSNEVAVSAKHHEVYHLYRVFDFRKRPKLFQLAGAIQETCELEPNSFRAWAA